MTKNKIMRVASVLLMAVLLTTCVISGTFAKYVTSQEGSDSARVAKWGVEITANGTAFQTEYAKTDTTVTDITNTVVSTEKVVAPGTDGSLVEMEIHGTPEVAVAVTYDATLTLENWTVDSADYCPLVFTVENTEYKIGDTYTTIADLKNAVESAIEGCAKNYAVGTDLSTKTADAPSVSWSWAFEGDNANDTALGDATDSPTISLAITTTVTQID